jgi:uncharacterized membrane protein
MTIRSAARCPACEHYRNLTVAVPRAEETDMKNCKLCGFSKFCNDLPGICISLQMAAVLTVVGVITYLFVTQEVLG